MEFQVAPIMLVMKVCMVDLGIFHLHSSDAERFSIKVVWSPETTS